jgi:hypothetical protein
MCEFSFVSVANVKDRVENKILTFALYTFSESCILPKTNKKNLGKKILSILASLVITHDDGTHA